jgi:hypothetical protein
MGTWTGSFSSSPHGLKHVLDVSQKSQKEWFVQFVQCSWEPQMRFEGGHISKDLTVQRREQESTVIRLDDTLVGGRGDIASVLLKHCPVWRHHWHTSGAGLPPAAFSMILFELMQSPHEVQ